MKRVLQSTLAAILLLCSAAAQDGLNEALAKLKEKAQRQDYSTRVDLHDRQMAVPAEPTAEDEALDAKLRQMEKELDRRAVISRGSTRPPRPARRRTMPRKQDRNWLTPALLDDDALEDAEIDSEQSDWIAAELERQQSIRQEEEALKNATDSPPLFKTPIHAGRETDATQSDLNSYSRSFNQFLSGERQSDREKREADNPNAWSAGRNERPESPFSLLSRNREKEEEPSGLSPLSRQRRQTRSLFEKPQRRSEGTISSRFSSPYKSPFKGDTSSDTESKPFQPSWRKKEIPLSPVEQIRKSSPIHKKDPFSKDFSPNIKGSIRD